MMGAPAGRAPGARWAFVAALALLVAAQPAASVAPPAIKDQLGLGRGALRLRAERLAAVQQQRLSADPEPLLVPLPNDTVPPAYWRDVELRLAHAASVSTTVSAAAAAELEDEEEPAAPNQTAAEPWKRIMTAEAQVNVQDTPEETSNWQWATPRPALGTEVSQSDGAKVRRMGVVPYDMQLGARIMYGISEKTSKELGDTAPYTYVDGATGTQVHVPASPPSQDFVDQTITAQCPMLMFRDALTIRAPHCGNALGSWSDQRSQRSVLRWNQNTVYGGLTFNVDSLVTGNGSVTFAEVNERLSLNKYVFHLSNCKGVPQYMVEESIVKVNHIAQRAFSTMYQHDVAQTAQAFFYQYTIKYPNGTNIAATALYRQDQDEVNFTSVDEEMSRGEVFAVASRRGIWKRSGWRECTPTEDRAWDISFPGIPGGKDTVATIQDLRVAASVVVTLMAFRDEDVASDGFQHVGQGHLYWDLVRTVCLVFLLALLACCLRLGLRRFGCEVRVRFCCFKLERLVLPMPLRLLLPTPGPLPLLKPVAPRQPPMQRVW